MTPLEQKLLDLLGGDFSGARPIFDPLTTTVNPANSSQFIRTQFPNNAIPANRQSPQALYFKSWFPTPNNGPGLYAYSPALVLNTDKFDIKVSPRLTAKDSIVSRYSYVANQEQDQQGYPALGYYPLHSRAQNAGLSYVHIFSPSVPICRPPGSSRRAGGHLAVLRPRASKVWPAGPFWETGLSYEAYLALGLFRQIRVSCCYPG